MAAFSPRPKTMPFSAEMSACPFCEAGHPHLEETDVRSWAVVCGGCGTIGPVGRDEAQAIDRWNRRPLPGGASIAGKAVGGTL